MIRADDSVRFATGKFDSGYLRIGKTWDQLSDEGHELGWHMHLMSYDAAAGCYSFNPEPAWLGAARESLAQHFDVRSTRTGWDFCSNWLMRRLDELGVVVDLSALPGNVIWQAAGKTTIEVNWLRAASSPYHPAADDYQKNGNLQILEVPMTGFPNSVAGMARRLAWRLRHACLSVKGLGSRHTMLTERWKQPPRSSAKTAAFFFHPSGLTASGIENFRTNLDTIRSLFNAEFVTASNLARDFDGIRRGG
jgi:hypothetical protein